MKMDELAEALAQQRAQRGLSLRAAAREAGVSTGTYYGAEQGRAVRAPTLFALMSWLDAPADEYVLERGERVVPMSAEDTRALAWAVSTINRVLGTLGVDPADSASAAVHLAQLDELRQRYTRAPRNRRGARVESGA